MTTRTGVTWYKGELYLYRFIDGKRYKVCFNKEVKLVDTMEYFNLNDDKFKQCCR